MTSDMSNRHGDMQAKDSLLATMLLAEGSPSTMSWEKAEGLVRTVETLSKGLVQRNVNIIVECMVMAGYTPRSIYRRVSSETPTGPLSLHIEGLERPTEIGSRRAEHIVQAVGLLRDLDKTEAMDAAVVTAMAQAGYERIEYFAKTGTVRPEM